MYVFMRQLNACTGIIDFIEYTVYILNIHVENNKSIMISNETSQNFKAVKSCIHI